MSVRAFRSFAKINLGLEVQGRLQGGYHELKTIFATISLHDIVEIEETPRGISVRSDHPGVPDDETNIAWRAAAMMQEISGRKRGVRITLHKNIAPGGGLGGGSSNAATVLRALDLMWELGLPKSRLVEAAKALGADVPYFLVGGPALGLGRGDLIRPLGLKLEHRVLLVPGKGGVSTAAVFKRFAEGALRNQRQRRSPVDTFVLGLAEVSSLRNDLEPAAIDVSPDLGRIAHEVRRASRATSATKAAMSGSGSSFFLLFKEEAQRVAAAGLLERSGIETLPCAFVSRRAFRERFEIPRPLSKRR